MISNEGLGNIIGVDAKANAYLGRSKAFRWRPDKVLGFGRKLCLLFLLSCDISYAQKIRTGETAAYYVHQQIHRLG